MDVIARHNQTHDAQALSNGSGDQPEGATGPANGNLTSPTPMDVDSQEASPSAPASSSSSLDKAKARVGFAVQLVNRALRGGEGPVLAPILIRLLPSLIRIQVLPCILACVQQLNQCKLRPQLAAAMVPVTLLELVLCPQFNASEPLPQTSLAFTPQMQSKCCLALIYVTSSCLHTSFFRLETLFILLVLLAFDLCMQVLLWKATTWVNIQNSLTPSVH